MSYSISVREFLKTDVDMEGFSDRINKEVLKINSKFDFLKSVNRIAGSREGTLKGLPVSFKDNICIKGMESTAGSKILEGYVPVFDATVVKRMKEAGCQILGKTNQDEFGFGTFSTNSGWEVPKNPLDAERSCGGSSGGAAGLVRALDMPHIALGQSTGGSISCPAAFCGVVGLTPTYGLVSRYGLIDYANSLDKIGALGKSVFDVALALSLIAGKDSEDSTTSGEKKDYTLINGNFSGKIAVPKEYFENLDEKVEKDVWKALKKMESMGMKYEEVSIKNTKAALYAYYIIACSEASTNLAKYCGLRYGMQKQVTDDYSSYFTKIRTKGFGAEAKRRILIGTFMRLSGYRDAYYLKAMKLRTVVINEFKSLFKDFDAIVGPTMPITAPKFSEIDEIKPIDSYHMDSLTVPHNLAGMPSISVPVGDKMPSGLHIIGNHMEESKIINIASTFTGEIN